MQRDIKFRGKRVDNGEWVYGDLVHNDNGIPAIREDLTWYVKPETVGQYIGLKDTNSFEVYHGDIVRIRKHTFVVEWDTHAAKFLLKSHKGDMNPSLASVTLYGKIVGNIHDNLNLKDSNNGTRTE